MTATGGSQCCAVSILVVGYNSAQLLECAIGSVSPAIKRHSYEVRFVNNGSDASEDMIRDRFPEVAIFPTRGNIGFGAANNYLAREAKGARLLLLNPDTRLEPSAIDILLDAAEADRSFGILGGLSISPAGEPLVMSRLEFPTLARILRGAIGKGGAPVLPPDAPGIFEVDAVSGAFMLIDRDWWDRLGGFDERFFLYAEELDLCLRLRQLGGKVGLVPAARVMHDVGSGEASTPARVLLSMRGSATFYRKHFSPAYAQACLLAHWLSCAVRFVVGSLLGPFSARWARVGRSMRGVTLRPGSWYVGYSKRQE